MSRLEAVAKGLFYPTPDRVVEAVAKHLARHPGVGRNEVVRVLDPCAGTGEPVERVTRALGGESYGVELSSKRSEKARQHVHKLLPSTSAFATKMSNKAFSVLFLNPPYDYDDEGERLENSFLVHFSKLLCPGGVLVFIVPQKRLGASARILASSFTNHKLYR